LFHHFSDNQFVNPDIVLFGDRTNGRACATMFLRLSVVVCRRLSSVYKMWLNGAY